MYLTLRIILTIKYSRYFLHQRCKPKSEDAMLCETPNLGIPGAINTNDGGTTPSSTEDQALLKIRISFILDGFMKYQNPNSAGWYL